MTTPSIAQQRVVLTAFLAVIGAVVWWQNSSGGFNYPVQKFSMTAVPELAAALDFTNAEASWSNLQFDAQGDLIIDALTEAALVDAIALIRDPASEPQLARIELLLSKQFGADASRQVIALLPMLKNYKEVEQRWWRENSRKFPPEHAKLFQLQDQLLGETRATKMFSEQRRLANLMRASYLIRNDTTLTEAEKNQALKDLQKAFQESGPSG